MSAREVLKTITEEIPIPIIVDNDTGIFLLESYVRGYHHVYMNIWNATINDYLKCKIEENNEFDPLAVALLHDEKHFSEKMYEIIPIKQNKYIKDIKKINIFCNFV